MQPFILITVSSMAATVLGAAPALAQTAPANKENTVSDVAVTGQRAAVKTSIDRRTYNVSKDLQGATGSIGDVLANLPSVEVSLDGDISLRGDAKVQVLIDGKPSALMSGVQRALTLQQMQAATVESIEVMTNPSAEFDPNGSAGIINIVTKKARAPGRSGGLIAKAGSEGRASLSLNGTYKAGKLTLAGSLSATKDEREWRSEQERTQTNPLTGAKESRLVSNSTRYDRQGWGATAGADYDFTARDRLSATLSHYRNPSTSLRVARYTEAANTTVLRDYDRVGDDIAPNESTNISASYRHAFAKREHEFRVNLQGGRSIQSNTTIFTNTYRQPLSSVTQDERITGVKDRFMTLTADYVLPMESGAKLRAGYSLSDTKADQATYGGQIDSVTGASLPLADVTNDYAYDLSVHALYATFQQSLGKWTALGGLRLEQSVTDSNLLTTGQAVRNDDFDFYPSLHLQHDLAENQKLKFSYSHRIARPAPGALNGFVFYRDDFNAFSGNPNLKPQDTHSLEAGWEYMKGGRSVLATLYLRRNYNAFSSVSRLISPTVLLTTTENLGQNTSGGLELATSGRLGETVNYNVSGNIFYNELETAPPLAPGKRSAVGHSVKGRFDYRFTPRDLVQLSAGYTGKRLRNQGYAPASSSLSLGYQHKFRPDVFAVLTVSDILRKSTSTTVTDTPDFYEISTQHGTGRAVSFAVTKLFGGRPPRDAAFEYVE